MKPAIHDPRVAGDARERYIAEMETRARCYTGPINCLQCGLPTHPQRLHDPACRCDRPLLPTVDEELVLLGEALAATTEELREVTQQRDQAVRLLAETRAVLEQMRSTFDGGRP